MKIRTWTALTLLAAALATGERGGADSPALSAQMSSRKDALMYLTRAILIGDKSEALHVSKILDESMSSHAKQDSKEDQESYAKVAAVNESLRKAVLSGDAAGAGGALGELVAACANCHKSHWGGRFFK